MKSYAETDSFAQFFPVYDEHSAKQIFRYEIIENSDKYFTVHISYRRFYKNMRSHRYFTFVSQTGELLEMYDIIDDLEMVARVVYPIYAADLHAHIKTVDTSDTGGKLRYNELRECANNYFREDYRLEYGFVYLTTDSIHFANPFCPERNGVEYRRQEYFKCSFTINDFKEIMDQRMFDYAVTGVWKKTLDEMMLDAPVLSGEINGETAELIWVEEEGAYYGYFTYPKSGIIFEFNGLSKKKKIIIWSGLTLNILRF